MKREELQIKLAQFLAINYRIQDQSSMKCANDLIELLLDCGVSIVDGLTGLDTREAFKRYLYEQADQCDRLGLLLSVGFIDVNGLKQINDTYTHKVGDIVLRGVADVLIYNTRPYDKAFRWGGDEFVIVHTGKSEDEARQFFGRLNKALAFTISTFENDTLSQLDIICSVGVAFCRNGKSADEVLDIADEAMYVAKKDKLGKVIFEKER